MRGLKAQKHLAQGNALGLPTTKTARPVRAKALKIKRLISLSSKCFCPYRARVSYGM